MITQPTASIPKLYIGIDVHKKNWTFHYQTDLFDGKTITQPASDQVLIDWVNKHFPNHQVTCAYEAGFSGYSAARSFQKQNWNVLVLNAADIPRPQKQSVVKSDKIDCRNICKQLANQSVKSIIIPEEQREQFRTLFRGRNNSVEGLRQVKLQIKSFLFYYGITIPEQYDNPNWSKDFLIWIKSQELKYETGKTSMEFLLRRYDFMKKELLMISTQLRAYARKHYKNDYYLLMSVPGVGGIVAVSILAEVGNLRKFNRFDDLASYVGLVPGIYESGESSIVRGMTPRAKSLLRSYLIEASWQALRVDPVLQEYYRKHYGKKPNKIIVKIARKLLSRIHAVIKTNKAYEIGVIK
ncbi:MAG: IS110 family transposase [Bacteroidota bacterium]|jgi:transposase